MKFYRANSFFSARAAAWCFLLLLILVVCFLPETAPAAVPPNFVVSDVADNWQEVVGITFDEANRMYVWERPGRVWIVENGVKSATPLIDISEEVSAWNDLGCLGFALDPQFRLNGYIYLYYVVDHYYLDNFGTPQYNPASNDYFRATIGRLTRYTARASDNFRSVDPASRKILLGETKSTGIPITYNTHSVGSLVFGTDGTLLASCGDGAALSDPGSETVQSYYAQALSEGIIKPKENIGAFRSQMVDCLSGKILRLNPATGDGVPSNPFYDYANPRSARSRVWTLGFRNPFRMTLKPGTGSHNPADANPGVLFVGDVGYQTWEEVSMITGPAMNAGWPIFEGFTQFPPGYEDFNPPNPDAPNPLYGIGGCTQQYFTFRDLLKEATLGTPSWPNPCNNGQQVPASIPHFVHTRPMVDWKHPSGPSRCGTFVGNNAAIANIGTAGASVAGPQFGGSCAIGGSLYNGDQFPASYKGTYIFADFTSGWIRTIGFDSNNAPVQVNDFGTGFEGTTAMVVHPVTGELYVGNVFYGLKKIVYGGNAAPKAVANADIRYGPAPLTVQFNGSASSDPEGQTLTYR
ncbi:MAG TPA: PQQ-dependent sugar dehydrogenase, partial [Verrucomicrobiae bacterium]|nr:PQQ-dependent sugar dehydrogenase [Verrucomicrobiae bacterium]